jgi:hypothetical protein
MMAFPFIHNTLKGNFAALKHDRVQSGVIGHQATCFLSHTL